MPTTIELHESVRTTLRTRAQAVADAEQALRRARNQLDSAVYDAVVRRGCQVTAVADAAGISRETIYKCTGRGSPQLSLG